MKQATDVVSVPSIGWSCGCKCLRHKLRGKKRERGAVNQGGNLLSLCLSKQRFVFEKTGAEKKGGGVINLYRNNPKEEVLRKRGD